jgi:hypothetical protein
MDLRFFLVLCLLVVFGVAAGASCEGTSSAGGSKRILLGFLEFLSNVSSCGLGE